MRTYSELPRSCVCYCTFIDKVRYTLVGNFCVTHGWEKFQIQSERTDENYSVKHTKLIQVAMVFRSCVEKICV